MTRSVKRLYLPYSEWPRDVKARWKKAFEPNTDLFHEGGPGDKRCHSDSGFVVGQGAIRFVIVRKEGMMMLRREFALILMAALCCCGVAAAQQSGQLPAVKIIATGGTIAGARSAGRTGCPAP